MSERLPSKKPLKLTTRGKIAGLALATAVTAPITLPELGKGLDAVAHAAGQSIDFSSPQPDAATKARMEADARSDELKRENANTLCIPQGTRSFTFESEKGKQGLNDAIYAIEGVKDPNDPCWDEAEKIVDNDMRALHPDYKAVQNDPTYIPQPMVGETIQIPVRMEHVPKQ